MAEETRADNARGTVKRPEIFKSLAFWTLSAAASKVLEDLFSGFACVFSFLFFFFPFFSFHPVKHSKLNKLYFSYV